MLRFLRVVTITKNAIKPPENSIILNRKAYTNGSHCLLIMKFWREFDARRFKTSVDNFHLRSYWQKVTEKLTDAVTHERRLITKPNPNLNLLSVSVKIKKTSANFVKFEITSQLLFAVTVLNLIFQWCLQFSSAFIYLFCIFCNFSVLQLCWFISVRMLFLSLINSWSEINWRCAVLKHYWIFYCNITATVLIFTARSIRFNALWTKFRLTNLFIYKVNPC